MKKNLFVALLVFACGQFAPMQAQTNADVSRCQHPNFKTAAEKIVAQSQADYKEKNGGFGKKLLSAAISLDPTDLKSASKKENLAENAKNYRQIMFDELGIDAFTKYSNISEEEINKRFQVLTTKIKKKELPSAVEQIESQISDMYTQFADKVCRSFNVAESGNEIYVGKYGVVTFKDGKMVAAEGYFPCIAPKFYPYQANKMASLSSKMEAGLPDFYNADYDNHISGSKWQLHAAEGQAPYWANAEQTKIVGFTMNDYANGIITSVIQENALEMSSLESSRDLFDWLCAYKGIISPRTGNMTNYVGANLVLPSGQSYNLAVRDDYMTITSVDDAYNALLKQEKADEEKRLAQERAARENAKPKVKLGTSTTKRKPNEAVIGDKRFNVKQKGRIVVY